MTATREDRDDAIAHIGLTVDAQLLLEWLDFELRTVMPATIEPCALRHNEGRRSLARELIEKLTRDHPSDRRTESSAEHRTEPAGRPRPRGARRPVPDTPAA